MLETVEQGAYERRHRQLRILVGVGDAKPAAEIDDGRSPAELRAAVGGEGGEPVDRHALGAHSEQLRSDVDVQPLRVQPQIGAACKRRGRLLRCQAELRAAVAGGDGPVRVGVDARRHAYEDAAHAGGRCALGVVRSVEHDEATGLRRSRRALRPPCCSRPTRSRHPRCPPDGRTPARRASRPLLRGPPLRTRAARRRWGTPSRCRGRRRPRPPPPGRHVRAPEASARNRRRAASRARRRALTPRRRRTAIRRLRSPPNRERAAAPT